MPNLVHGQDPGGAMRPVQVDENGNLSVDLVSGITVSTTVSSITNTITVQQLSGSADSTSVQGISRQTNPSATADGSAVTASFDDLGRQVITPYQVRDLVATARASTATLAEVTLLSGIASTFLYLVEIGLSNNTDVAVRINLRETTGGGVIRTFDVPANDSIQKIFLVPVPQTEAASSWTIQNAGTEDISTTDVTVSALFIKNV